MPLIEDAALIQDFRQERFKRGDPVEGGFKVFEYNGQTMGSGCLDNWV